MPQQLSEPVDESSIAKVDNAVAVGEDLVFQEKWWRFERAIWMVFLLILMADLLGVFGRGWLSKKEIHREGTGLDVWYETVERSGTPSTMSVDFQPGSIQGGEVRLFVSNGIVKDLGNQRIAPQPERSIVGQDGVTYTFPTTVTPAKVSFSLQPSFPGVHHFLIQVPGKSPVIGRVLVMP